MKFKPGDLLWTSIYPGTVYLLVEIPEDCSPDENTTHMMVRFHTGTGQVKACALQKDANWKTLKAIEEDKFNFQRIGHIDLSSFYQADLERTYGKKASK